ncbi:hypothetical protein V1478_001192, partial [Vespula squamosa]
MFTLSLGVKFPFGPPTSSSVALGVVDKEGGRFSRAFVSTPFVAVAPRVVVERSSQTSAVERGEGILAVVAIALLAALVEGFSPNPGGIPSAPRRIPSVEFRNSLPKSGRR